MNRPKLPTFYRGKYGQWRLIYILIFGLLIFAIAFTYYFIYQNIYSTVANANAITSLKTSVNIYNLDIPAFEKASAAIETKQKLEKFPSDIRNIFYYSSGSVSKPASSTATTST